MGSALSRYTCCTGSRKNGAITLCEKHQYGPLLSANTDNDEKMAANRILNILQFAPTSKQLTSQLQELKKESFSAAYNWEGVAVYLLEGVQVLITKGTELSTVMKTTYDGIKADYDIWKAENPEFAMIVEISAEVALTCLALAVLAAVLPWALEALGFGTLGPRLGSWAARWQSTYLGATPAKSLFSFLESMGMKYGIKAVALL